MTGRVPSWCEHVGTRHDPKARCGNKARWRSASGVLLCGRHTRYAGRVEQIAPARLPSG